MKEVAFELGLNDKECHFTNKMGKRKGVPAAPCRAHPVPGTHQTPGSGGKQWSSVPALAPGSLSESRQAA